MGIDHRVFGEFSLFRGLLEVMKQQRMIALFGPEDVMHPGVFQVPEVGTVGTEAVFDDDQIQMGMLLP